MAYSQFTLKEVKRKFQLAESKHALFHELQPIPISNWLQETLTVTKTFSLLSEKAKSEFVIAPILMELARRNQNIFAIFSGINLEADDENGLNGECDFVLSKKTCTVSLESPIFILIEAKNDNIMNGLGQCIAQMLGARIYNQKDNVSIETIYGCVTTANEWQFLKLDGNQIVIDDQRYYLNEIERILAVLQKIVDFYI